jgi:ribonuclease T1
VFRIGQASLGWFRPKLALALLLTSVLASAPAAKESLDGSVNAASVALASLPAEAQRTQQLILRGGPFPYRKDGSTFGNRERQLPAKPRGFYKEYTVKTPGSSDRGARRIVCGGPRPAQPEACFYTADHYASFRRIVQ